MYNQGKIMRRLLGRSAADTSPNDANLAGSGFPTSAAAYRPNASQDAEYRADVPIACVDKSADGQVAVLGGRHILKTVHFDGLNIKEGIDLRSIITSQISNKGNASTAEQLSIKDVKLAPDHATDPRIFTACGSGRIFMYDVNRLGSSTGLEFIQTREDTRQINKLDFNPYKPTWLLSGGQDGVVRCQGPRHRPERSDLSHLPGLPLQCRRHPRPEMVSQGRLHIRLCHRVWLCHEMGYQEE